jgi:hypothetical protein
MKPSTFFSAWDQSMIYLAYAAVGLAILILLYHEFRIFKIKNHKEKYDYVNLHEIRFFWYAVIALILAVIFIGNTFGSETITARGDMLWFYVRVFISVSVGVVAYFICFSLVRIYYPRSVEKRLNKLRNMPRTSSTGNPMRKLSETEEDAHLEASQIAEESSEVHSVDYDVWIDEKTGEKKIEKYFSYQHTEECTECGYVTMKIHHEDVETAPTADETGVLIKHYKCTYCGHREQRQVVLAKLSDNVK